MVRLIEMTPELRNHWLLHLDAAGNDTPSNKNTIRQWVVQGNDIPNLYHPSLIHDWLEIPEIREYLESLSG